MLTRVMALCIVCSIARSVGAQAPGVTPTTPAPTTPAPTTPAPTTPAPTTPAPTTPAPTTPAPTTPAPTPAPTTPAPTTPAPTTPTTPSAFPPVPGDVEAIARDPAWLAYDDAFALAAKGETDAANTKLADIAKLWPTHPAGMRAQALVARLEPIDEANAPNNVARGELVFWSTLGGVSLAANACVIISCASSRETAATYMVGVGGALAVSVLATRDGIRQGEAQLYNSAMTWGAWNAFAINNDFADTSDKAVIALAAQGAGLGAGFLLWKSWRPTQGDVALTNTFWFWGQILTVWAAFAANAENDLELRHVVIAGDAALVLGGLMSRQVKMSRGRTLLIDVGGVLGTLAGALGAAGTSSDQTAGTLMFVGTAAGLGLGVLASQNWDAPEPPKVAPTVVIGPDRTPGVGVGTAFQF